MNLISCTGCGVVLDKDNLAFPEEDEIWLEGGSIDLNNAVWDGNDFVPKVECPVCKQEIPRSN